MTWTNGNRYVGAWLEGKRTGLGVFYWANGARYHGEFLNNLRHGNNGTVCIKNDAARARSPLVQSE